LAFQEKFVDTKLRSCKSLFMSLADEIINNFLFVPYHMYNRQREKNIRIHICLSLNNVIFMHVSFIFSVCVVVNVETSGYRSYNNPRWEI